MTNSNVTNNHSGLRGGGIKIWPGLGSNSFRNCTFSGNSANANGYGGGLYLGSMGDMTLTNCTISGNTIAGCGGVGVGCEGGGIWSDSHSLNLVNCTIYNNSARSGGGIFLWDSANTVTKSRNTIISMNSASIGAI